MVTTFLPLKVYVFLPEAQGQLSHLSDLAKFLTHSRFYGYPC